MRQWIGIILMTMLILTACYQRDLSYDYLMSHPNDLPVLFNQCQQKPTASCETIQRAMNDFSSLVNEQALNPQQFGIRIMKTQQQLIDLSQDFKIAQQEGHRDQILLAEEAYRDQKKQLQILYQVIVSAFYGYNF